MNSLWHFVNQWQVYSQSSIQFNREEPEKKNPNPGTDEHAPENPGLPEIPVKNIILYSLEKQIKING